MTGIISSLLAALIVVASHILISSSSENLLSSRLSVVLPALTLYTLFAGGIYGKVFRRTANDRSGGWIFGASTGFILWMLNPAIWFPWFGEEPLFIGRSAIHFMIAHVLHGGLLGLAFPWVHRILSRSQDTLPD